MLTGTRPAACRMPFGLKWDPVHADVHLASNFPPGELILSDAVFDTTPND